MRLGDVLVARLTPRSGSEQRRRRPVVVVSHDGFNTTSTWRSVIVVPLSTATRQARRGPTAVPVRRGDGGLTHHSIALCHQVTTLSREKIERRLGTLSPAALHAVSEGLKAALDLD